MYETDLHVRGFFTHSTKHTIMGWDFLKPSTKFIVLRVWRFSNTPCHSCQPVSLEETYCKISQKFHMYKTLTV